MPKKPERVNRPWKSERQPYQRRSADNQKFYNSTAWRKVAALHKKNNPFCVKCLEAGVYEAVKYTDHIIRIEDGGPPLASENLQSLCKFHHDQKSGREAHGYKEKK